MIIDFHTHLFPDALAPRALSVLVGKCEGAYKPVTDMTLSSLEAKMSEWGIDASVILPVITKASQTKSTNLWAQSILSDRIISFGGIWPHSRDYKSDIDFVVSLGLKGLKFHAEYQDFLPDDPAMLRIYDYAFSKGLIIVQHAGYDPGYPPPYKSNPERFRSVVDAMRGGVFVAAHLGGHAQWDDVEKYLVGTDIYLDTAMGFNYYSTDRFLRILKNHGSDKILFATDSPWSSAKEEMETLNALPLPAADISAVLGGNARRLLKI